MKLTPKQEAFALKYVECSNASEAYRECYDVGENTDDKTVWDNAGQLARSTAVAHRVAEIRKRLEDECIVNVVTHTKEMDDVAQEARDAKQYSAAITAYKNKATVHGLYKDKGESGGIYITIPKDIKDV